MWLNILISWITGLVIVFILLTDQHVTGIFYNGQYKWPFKHRILFSIAWPIFLLIVAGTMRIRYKIAKRK